MPRVIKFSRPEGDMTYSEAIAILSTANRECLHDRAFGDTEMYWMIDGKEVASAYFGNSNRYLTIVNPVNGASTTFADDTAYALREKYFSTKTQLNS